MAWNSKALRIACVVACALIIPGAGQAQDKPQDKAEKESGAYPSRPVNLIVPYPAGGTSDVVGRILARALEKEMGGTFIVTNRAGAATAIGATSVARAPKDGYTLLLAAGTTFVTNPHLIANLPYRLEDFDPVALVVTVPFAFVVRKDFPAKTLEEFIAYAKANPNKINNATDGQGSVVHILGEAVANRTDTKLTHVHYKGAAPAASDLMGGIVDSTVQALTTAVPNTNAGRYRALAIVSNERSPLMPNVPTFREKGFPDLNKETWYGVFAPAGTPPAIVTQLNGALRRITTSKSFEEEMRKHGNEAKSSTPAELRQFAQEENRSWGNLIKQLNIRIE